MGFFFFGVWSAELIPLGMLCVFPPAFLLFYDPTLFILRRPFLRVLVSYGGSFAAREEVFPLYVSFRFSTQFWIFFLSRGLDAKWCTQKSNPKKPRSGFTGLAWSCYQMTVFVRHQCATAAFCDFDGRSSCLIYGGEGRGDLFCSVAMSGFLGSAPSARGLVYFVLGRALILELAPVQLHFTPTRDF